MGRTFVTYATPSVNTREREDEYMQLVMKYAIACAIVGLIPFSFPLLMLIEVALVYHLSCEHRRPFNIAELGIIWSILLFVSFVLHGIVGTIFDFLGPAGWIAKAGIAFGFVLGFGALVDGY